MLCWTALDATLLHFADGNEHTLNKRDEDKVYLNNNAGKSEDNTASDDSDDHHRRSEFSIKFQGSQERIESFSSSSSSMSSPRYFLSWL